MVLIVDFGSKKTPDIAKVLQNIGRDVKVIDWQICDQMQLTGADKIILSGAPILLSEIDFNEYVDKFYFLRDFSRPILGICFGHQLLGLIYGCKIYKGEAIRKFTEIEIITKSSIFKGLSKKVLMLEDHTEGITLSNHFICLAKSDKYEIEAMKHLSKPHYGVQFHPESSGKNGELLINNFTKIANP